jgi:hypothetical protein
MTLLFIVLFCATAPLRLSAQVSVHAQAIPLVTTAWHMPGDEATLTEFAVVQPAVMLDWRYSRFLARVTLDAEGWTIADGELSPGSHGEGFYDRRHPHTYVHELIIGGTDLLGTVDGLKAFHARRVGLRLVPDWPLTTRPELLAAPPRPPITAAEANGFRFDHASLLACAWGKPSHAFGPMYEPFDDPRRVARLPGPPYHFMTHVARVSGDIGSFKPGAEVEIEYDIPADAWYFRENGSATMPFCVVAS